jgi:hypothetical protein
MVTPAEAPTPPRRRPRRRIYLVLGALALAASLAGYGYVLLRTDRSFAAAQADADRLDAGWRLADLEARRADVPPAENAALRIQSAQALLPPSAPRPDWSLDRELADVAPNRKLSARQVAALRAETAEVDAALREARTLADCPRGRHVLPRTRDGVSTVMVHLNTINVLSGFLQHDAYLKTEEGDVAAALRDAKALFHTARSVGDEPIPGSQFVRLARGRDALHILERLLAQGTLSEKVLREWQTALEDEAGQPFALVAARGQRALNECLFDAIQSGEHKLEYLPIGQSRDEWFGKSEMHEFWRLYVPGAIKNSRAVLLRDGNELVEIAKRPLEEQPADLERLGKAPRPRPLLARVLRPPLFTSLRYCHAGVAYLRSAAVLLAVEQFRLRHGHWPGSLVPLVPDFLPAVPLDPLDGQPLRFRRLEDGVVVYSVGLDGKDDGGALARQSFTVHGVDLGYRLWDVSARGQAPAPLSEGEGN